MSKLITNITKTKQEFKLEFIQYLDNSPMADNLDPVNNLDLHTVELIYQEFVIEMKDLLDNIDIL